MNLSLDDIKQLWEAGFYTPKGYLHHLILAHRPTGEPLKIGNVSEFCQRWNLPERQFYDAKATLVADDLVDETITEVIALTARPIDISKPSTSVLGELVTDTLDAQPEQPTGNSDWATWYDEAR